MPAIAPAMAAMTALAIISAPARAEMLQIEDPALVTAINAGSAGVRLIEIWSDARAGQWLLVISTPAPGHPAVGALARRACPALGLSPGQRVFVQTVTPAGGGAYAPLPGGQISVTCG